MPKRSTGVSRRCWPYAPLRSAASAFDDDAMPVEVVEDEPVVEQPLLVHELRHAGTRGKAVIVEDDDAAGSQARPDPVEDVLRRAVDVDVAMTQAKTLGGDRRGGVIREDPLQQLDVGQAERADELGDRLARRVVVLAVAVVRVHLARLDDAAPGVAE